MNCASHEAENEGVSDEENSDKSDSEGSSNQKRINFDIMSFHYHFMLFVISLCPLHEIFF